MDELKKPTEEKYNLEKERDIYSERLQQELKTYGDKLLTHKKLLISFKNHLVKKENFQFATLIRTIQNVYFPETPEIKEEKLLANKVSNLLTNAGYKCDDENAWTVYKIIEKSIKENNFNLDNYYTLLEKREEIFGK